MHKTTAVNIFPLFRYLPIAVFFLSTFLFSFQEVIFSLPPAEPPATGKIFNNQCSTATQIKEAHAPAFKAAKRNNTLEARLPLLNLAVPHQAVAFQLASFIYSFPGKKEIPQLYRNPSGCFNFISRFFPISILPNAP
jgi:hypothetical protein